MKILEIKTKKRLIGDTGEAIAKKYLKKQGYKILKTNYVALGNEIDIISEKDGTVAFIEVKTRSFGKENPSEPRPSSSVTPDKQRKIINAAKFYAKYNANGKALRLDVIEILLDGKDTKEINHIEGAFNINTAFGTGKQ